VHILLIEENAQDYLEIRQTLDADSSKFQFEWAPNYETATKRIKDEPYDAYLVGYRQHQPKRQHHFLEWLYQYTEVPVILLLITDTVPDDLFIDETKADAICKIELSAKLLERSVKAVQRLLTLQQSLQQAEKKYARLFDNAATLLAVLSPEGIVREVNHATTQFFKLATAKLIGLPLWESRWAAYAAESVKQQLQEVVQLAAQGQTIAREIELTTARGKHLTLDLIVHPVKNRDETIQWLLVEGRDLSHCKAIEDKLSHAALHDPLTGLSNRQLFIERLEKEVTKARDDKHYRFAVMFMDVDRFRVVNESLGHEMGDWLLMEITQRLFDCVPEQALLARSGGDEFMLLMPELTNLTAATRLAALINRTLAEPFILDGYEVITSISIGIAYSSEEQEDSADMLRNADTAMYQAKSVGKSCYVVFNKRMHHQTASRLKIESELYHGLEQDNFMLYYQPQTQLDDDKLVGAEALIRFNHPKSGLLMPLEFMPILEDTGIIIRIGEWVLHKACQQFRAWLDAGLELNHIAINLSAHQFHSRQLLDKVIQALKEADLSSESLELEIKESVLLEDARLAMQTLKRCKEMGIRVIIDDFGTGYASLSYLKKFPADALKIDKSFVKGITKSPEDTAIIVATLDMAHALGMTVTAEGVETTEQRDFLRDHGCELAQGFLYSPPLEVRRFFRWATMHSRDKSPRLPNNMAFEALPKVI